MDTRSIRSRGHVDALRSRAAPPETGRTVGGEGRRTQSSSVRRQRLWCHAVPFILWGTVGGTWIGPHAKILYINHLPINGGRPTASAPRDQRRCPAHILQRFRRFPNPSTLGRRSVCARQTLSPYQVRCLTVKNVSPQHMHGRECRRSCCSSMRRGDVCRDTEGTACRHPLRLPRTV